MRPYVRKMTNELQFHDLSHACYREIKLAGGKCFNGHQCYLGYLGLCDVAYVPPKPGPNTEVLDSIEACRRASALPGM